MSQENSKKLVENVNSLLVSGASEERHVIVDEDSILKVWVRELSFLDTQKAIGEVVSVDQNGAVEIDLSGYWKYMLNRCIERTEPELSRAQILALKPSIASQITAMLPQPQDLVTGPLADGLEG